MSIIVKNMRLPSNCWECDVGGSEFILNGCPFYNLDCEYDEEHGSYINEQENYRDCRHPNCPLVEVNDKDWINFRKLDIHTAWIREAENCSTHITFVYSNDIANAKNLEDELRYETGN